MSERNGYISWFVEILDLFGIDFSLYFRKQKSYKSIFGSIIGLSSICILLYITYHFGKDIFVHSNFTIITNFETTANPSVNLSNIPILFSLSLATGETILPNETLFTFELKWIGNKLEQKDGVVKNEVSITQISYERCDYEKHFSNHTEYWQDLNISKYWCINPGQNITIFGRHGNLVDGFQNWIMYLIKCPSGSLGCDPDVNAKWENSVLVWFYFTNVIDHYAVNPVKPKLRSEAWSVSPTWRKKYNYKWSESKYSTDSGLIFEKWTKYHTFETQFYTTDIDTGSQNALVSNSSMGYLSFTCYEYIITYKRVYVKAQSVIANIGGCINFVYMISLLISKYFTMKYLELDWINTLLLKQHNGESHKIMNNNIRLGFSKFKQQNVAQTFSTGKDRNINTSNLKYTSSNALIQWQLKPEKWIVNSKIRGSLEAIKGNLINISNNSLTELNGGINIKSGTFNGNFSHDSVNYPKWNRTFRKKWKKISYVWYYYLIPDIMQCNNKWGYFVSICKRIIYSWLSIEYMLPYIEKGNHAFEIINDERKNINQHLNLYSIFRMPVKWEYDKYLTELKKWSSV